MRPRHDAATRSDRTAPGTAGGRRPVALAVGLLAAVCFLTYIAALRGGFVSDDVLLRDHTREVVAVGGWAHVFRTDLVSIEAGGRTGLYRPLAILSLVIDGALSGDSPVGYHLTNLVLHFAATALVLALALQMGLATLAATGAALFFAAHPVHVEAVAWISGRFDLLCGTLYLSALCLFARAKARRSMMSFGAGLAAGAAALLAKEMAVTLPAGVFLLDLLGLPRRAGARPSGTPGFWREGWRGALGRSAPFAAVVAGYLVLRTTSEGIEILSQPGQKLPRLELVGTAGRAVLYYLGLLLFPAKLRAFPMIPPVTQPLNPHFLAGVLALATLIGLGLRWRRTRPVAAFGILFLLVSLLPVSNVVGFYPVAKTRFAVAERYLYLPSAGFVLALAALLWELVRRERRFFAAGVALLTLAGAGRSLARVPVWRSPEALFETNARQGPRDPRVHLMLGAARHQAGRFAEARAEIETAMRLDPRFFEATLEMAAVLMSERRYGEAERWYRRAAELEPLAEDARMGVARALRHAGRLPEAKEQFDSMAALGARDSQFLVNRGELLLATGELDAAERDFAAAITANRRRKEAHYNLAVVQQQRGLAPEAEASARRSLAIDPRYAEPRMLLGNLAAQRGDFAAAAREFEAAVQLDTTLVRARVNLGASYLNLGEYGRAIAVLEAVLRHAPSGPAWVNLAEAQSRTGAKDAAVRSFREALRLDPELIAAQRGLGLLLADLPGGAREAQQLLQPLADARPDDRELRDALDRLLAAAPGKRR